ncbi:sulfotransferase family protein [Qipengyuania sphaerica]|uniref:sulfotransferase family protein n=1 Tax=Qipengyuania sphaerica TaxID=2867243 RepID=UPI001C887ECE|nr:sulfotransferase [Qipengyuania sphaerica]MBX7540817.1 sulfotransferase [Qipengyuania sphaerica]
MEPVFVVGQPRSGSTITTRVLNEQGELFVLNDFYALQAIDAENLWDKSDAASAGRVARIVFERIEIRATQEVGKTLNQSVDLSAMAVEKLRSLACRDWPDGTSWNAVIELMLGEAAELAGCSRWGWNTPQDHLHLERLLTAWPGAKVLFVLREPEAVLRSYKNVSGPWHDARRYNPATIGLAWKVAAQNYLQAKASRPGQVMLLRYEDLVAETDAMIRELGDFLELEFPGIDLASFGRNSSHSASRASKPVTGAEVWMAEKVIGDKLGSLGFRGGRQAARPGGMIELARSLIGSGLFLAGQVLTDRDRRRRALNFLRRS